MYEQSNVYISYFNFTRDSGGRAVDGGQEDSESLASSVTQTTRGRPGPGPAD